ncbi:RNA 2',3'-cyclic phosphodiesterase [Ramlibacter solisilvae]|uniref:RNA 2',3'-cyclic phosphodiesterase n=1 Tax=Ramlibacter tataouinensis TaxID=94132 RepID=A0A127JNX1_9BURK|nr:RNA 2',3'-cyclic phosphodiesterase [Ramlibacter tataouinensis]AMO21701.1 hypothetical protein UC35_00960 [Ramlibacter tataouinensis]
MSAAHPDRSLRLFTALWPPPPVREAIARWQHQWQWPPGAAVVPTDRLHITLHFLGNVPAARVDGLRAALRLPSTPFRLDLGRPGLWGGGIAVLSPDCVPEALGALHERLAAALTAAGLPTEERPYKPHVTLARRARGAKAPAEGPGLRWDAQDGFVLVESLPGGRGYKVLDRFGPA